MMDRAHRRSIIPLIAAASICLYGEAGSVVPSFWNVRTQAAFSSGELNNITVDSRGVVSLSPTFELIGETGELYVWSLARNAAGDVFAGTGSSGKIFKLDKGSGELSLWCDLPDPDVLSLVSGEKGGALRRNIWKRPHLPDRLDRDTIHLLRDRGAIRVDSRAGRRGEPSTQVPVTPDTSMKSTPTARVVSFSIHPRPTSCRSSLENRGLCTPEVKDRGSSMSCRSKTLEDSFCTK